jgi:hypothetical protein
VSYHVRTLTELGLLKLVRRRTRRGAVEHYYRATGRATVSDRAWSQVPGVVRRSMTGVALEQAIEQVASAAAGGGFDAEDATVTRHSLALDDEGVRELTEAVDELQRELDAIKTRSARRVEGGDGDARQVGVVTMQFELGRVADAAAAER